MLHLLRNKAIWSGVLVAALAMLFFLTKLGIPYAGAKSYEIKSTLGGSQRFGWSLGSSTVYLRKGQTFVVNYDVAIKTGKLRFHLLNRCAPFGKGTVGIHVVGTSGPGEYKVQVHKSGWHVLIINASHYPKSYDLDYTARWGVGTSW